MQGLAVFCGSDVGVKNIGGWFFVNLILSSFLYDDKKRVAIFNCSAYFQNKNGKFSKKIGIYENVIQ